MTPIPPSVTLKGIWAALIALAFLLALALLVVQTVRLEGFKIWPISVEGYVAKSERLQKDVTTCKDAQEEAARAQQAVVDAAQRKYDSLKERADSNEKILNSMARSLTAAYADANRVRNAQAVDRAPSGADSSAGSDDPGISEAVPDGSFVAISESDLQACADSAAYAVAAHNWASGLNQEGSGP